MQLDIRKLDRHDLGFFKELIRVFEDVFEMQQFPMPADSHLQGLLEQERFIAFAALTADGTVAGGLTAYVLQQYYAVRPLAYVYDVAVRQAWQRQGIGRRLLSAIGEYCREAGMETVFVQAAADSHALRFYYATGGSAEQVVHFTYPLHG